MFVDDRQSLSIVTRDDFKANTNCMEIDVKQLKVMIDGLHVRKKLSRCTTFTQQHTKLLLSTYVHMNIN